MFKLTGRFWKLWIAVLLVLGITSILMLKTGALTYKMDSAKIQKYQMHRPPEWATPIEKNGIQNFHRISENLYRGEKPTAIGIKQLKDMGIKTIIDLRSFSSDKDEIGGIEIGYEHIDMKTWHPEEEDIVRFLKIVTDNTKTPVFVHCRYGADRTGLMCAIYRVVVCGWSKEAAADEMIYGGYGFHPMWKNLINYFINLNIEKLKQRINSQNANSGPEQTSKN
jgi:protein tyrosine/serine phosphatase